MRTINERKTLGEILSSSTNDVLIEEHIIIMIREKARDEFSGVCKYIYETGELESIDYDSYSLNDYYDKYRWKNKNELVVWQDLTGEPEEQYYNDSVDHMEMCSRYILGTGT